MAKAAPIFALLAGLGALIGLAGANTGVLTPMTGFTTFVGSALLGGVVTTLLSLVALFLSRGGRNPDGMRFAIAGLAVGIGLVLVVVAAASPGSGLPPINDITTDLGDPPSFAAAAAVPGIEGRDMSYPEDFKSQVLEAYPDLKAKKMTLSKEAGFLKAVMIAEDLGWEVVAKDPATGILVAQDQTPLFRFVDDVAIRVTADGPGSKMDMRSKSRDGQGDIGANAARIRRFFEEMDLR